MLGGSKRTLRAKAAAALINQQALAEDASAAATVLLTFHVLQSDSTMDGTLALSKTVSSSGTALQLRTPGSEALRKVTQVLLRQLGSDLLHYRFLTSNLTLSFSLVNLS